MGVILADAGVPAGDPRIWVEAGSKAFHEGGAWVLIGGALMILAYWAFKFGIPRFRRCKVCLAREKGD